MRRVLVTGSRDLQDFHPVWRELDHELTRHWHTGGIIVIHGSAPRGADLHAHNWCYKHGYDRVTEEPYPAEWDLFGKAAGHIRNKKMVDLGADIVLAFPRGEAKGTMNCVAYAKAARIPVIFG